MQHCWPYLEFSLKISIIHWTGLYSWGKYWNPDSQKVQLALNKYKLFNTDICVYNHHVLLYWNVIRAKTSFSCFSCDLTHCIHSGRLLASHSVVIMSAWSLKLLSVFFLLIFLKCHRGITTNQSLDALRPWLTWWIWFSFRSKKGNRWGLAWSCTHRQWLIFISWHKNSWESLLSLCDLWQDSQLV